VGAGFSAGRRALGDIGLWPFGEARHEDEFTEQWRHGFAVATDITDQEFAMTSSPIVILAGARTPIGKLSGSLASMSAVQLGGLAIGAALDKAGLSGEQIDYVYMGHVLQAGAGQITSRQAAVNGGIPMSVPATTVNKVCLSGMDAVYQADRRIRSGDADIVVAGGMESMTNAPHLLAGARSGYRIGDGVLVDSMMYDGLYCAFDECAMGEGTEKYAQAHGLIREHMDAMAAESHRRADAAQQAGLFADEIVAVTIPQRRGDALVVAHDEGVRGETTIESLAGLRPAFDKQGHITAGNASQISDGASAMVITTAEVADRLGVTPLAEIIGYGQVAGPDASLLHQPSRAIRAALDRAGLSVGDVDLFEINEAFAAVGVASADDLGISMDVVNVNGGAIAVGHPLGMSGNRITLHLALELARRGGGIGAAALCGGGGQGDAILLRVGT
jgi:acetyl-CoA C-acetyltransferase